MQAENRTCQATSNEYKCSKCHDSEVIFYEEVNEFGMRVSIQKDCECKAQRVLERRLKNAMIPEEFADARFDSYKRENEEQRLLYNTMAKYLKNFKGIKNTKQNSLGFIATFGELRIKQLEPAKRAQAKREHNSFGLGKTHLQVAAAKYLMKQGYSVLLISDGTFMDDLIAAKMMNDDKKEFNRLLDHAKKVEILIWDDLGKSKWSEAKENLYYQIIDYRYRHNLPILYSSNEDDETLGEKIGFAANSRLKGMSKDYIVAVEGEDYREKE
ncbi:ATP-binding protein [Bacillus cytotoxicus]|uniref:ATP-binding protein n=1 Tax=Bacillus cytotoxicus TaxID=580165 RepID=UPI002447D433|nr:ATP-binding protein [Bacillus cytotoxicus]MDH2858880.1 ATP-binding protein [Bacillus cytotoxicus]MDH2871363.1 ATP-binding protein [Bacillus cytotoxicus]MDH2874868.1 ATP-binding protein [Bacillus cytotoxicus]MDH2919758.1 ATP-binding protein [Bacillus cytotoxicus]